MSSLLTQRLAALKAMSNTRTYSDDKSLPYLSLYLAIYQKAESECYKNYMEGAKCLYTWLTSGDTIPLVVPPILSLVPLPKIPRLLYTYEMGELAKIIKYEPEVIFWHLFN